MWRYDGLDGFQLFGRIGSRIDLSSRKITVSQPERDLTDILCRLEYDDGAGVSQHGGESCFFINDGHV